MELLKNDYYDHPVFHPNQLHFETNAIMGVKKAINQWIWNGGTGGLIYGCSRAGKTRSMKKLYNDLYTRGKKKIPGYYVSIPKRDNNKIATLFRRLCWKENLRVSSRDTAEILAERYIQYLLDESCEADIDQVVLVVDEMHRLKPHQFNVFAELYDELLEFDVSLTVVFVGNDPECIKLVESIEKQGMEHIMGRFFTQRVKFHGLTSKKDVNMCLSQYDTLRFPENGPTYVEHFLPDAAKKGWKFACLSKDIWRVYRDLQKQYKIESWGMQYFMAMANTLLCDFLPLKGVDYFSDDMVKESIRVSGLISSLVIPVK